MPDARTTIWFELTERATTEARPAAASFLSARHDMTRMLTRTVEPPPLTADADLARTVLVTCTALTTATIIPSIGLTFAEAAAKVTQMVTKLDSKRADGDTDEARDDLYFELDELNDALLGAEPRTLADVVALLDRLLCPSLGLPIGGGEKRELDALARVRATVASMVEGEATGASPNPTDAGDSFAGALAALDAEAPIPLDMPQRPSDAVLAAGAAAAGIPTERFAAGLAAAVEAFKMECAA